MFSPNQKINKLPLWLPLVLVALFWLYTLFFIPTFDLDESLYRRAAEEMKLSGNWWLPTWDGVPLYHKPPLLYWLMILSSYLVDGIHAGVSATAARIPSLLSSIGILIGLYKISPKEKWIAPFLYLSALFPVLTGTAAIFDPLQTLFLLPTLYYFSKFFETGELSKKQTLWITFSLFAATAVKGLNGLIVPGTAFVFHSLLVTYRDRKKITSIFQIGLKTFLPATFLSFLFYLFLDFKMGRAFTHEFFMTHHFGRSQNAMEDHGGSFFYHPLFVWISASLLGVYLIPKILQKGCRFSQKGFALSFALSFILVFSFSATKLPHYTWPVWMALAYQGALLSEQPDTGSRLIRWLSYIPVWFWILLFLIFALSPVSFLASVLRSEQALAILHYYPSKSRLIAALFCFCAVLKLSVLFSGTTKTKPIFLATINLLCCLMLGLAVGPTANTLMFEPQTEIAQKIKSLSPAKEDCIFYTGPHSPTISLALGNEVFHNHCAPGSPAKYLVVPEWKLHECKERGFSILAQSKYLYLCGL